MEQEVRVDITNISWDTDGASAKSLGLPRKLIDVIVHVEDPEDDEEIADVISDDLSDAYGFCHNGFNWTRHITKKTKNK